MIVYSEANFATKLCGGSSSFQKNNGIAILFVWSIIPSLTMLTFGLLTIRHVQQSTQRIVAERQQQIKSIDRQLIRLTLIQSVLFGLLSAAGALGGIFNIIGGSANNDAIALAKQQLYSVVLSYIGVSTPCISFYLSTLTSKLFRRELFNAFHLQRRQNQVHTIANTNV